MTTPLDQTRAAFEAHRMEKTGRKPLTWDEEHKRKGMSHPVTDALAGRYFLRVEQAAWEAWQAAIASRWIRVEDRIPPACHTIIAHGKKYGKKWPTPQVYETYTGTRPRETVEDEEITHWQFRPDAPTHKTHPHRQRPRRSPKCPQ